MRNRIFPLASLAVAAIALSSCAMTPAETARAADAKAATQAALGKELAGLTPTETRDCMDNYQSSSLKAYGGTLVYSVSKSLKYVNDTGGGCEAVERGDILVTTSPSGRVCRGDIARTVMPGSRMPSGSCALSSFTTYRAK
jgi:ABC-type transporter MlaC component